ncbi:low molecular weight phosphatase family protein [Nocardioides pocheonensis]|uniref:Low molecular weight phosphatase family protein n=1 Tax=Nocardioides pocheonensis TaxID=661485 RepID=A0A3N0GXX3_9ACTN|nr:low molecular weight phosphatase family protein [Nocardioides pocheonensis]
MRRTMAPESIVSVVSTPARASAAPFRVLFVCIGNVCRSPVGERLLASRLPPDRFEVSSAGVGAMIGYAMSKYAAEELRTYGGDPTGFAARQLTPHIVEASDLVLTATRELRSQVLAELPTALRRTFTILEFAALVEQAEGSTPHELVKWAGAHRSLVAHLEQDVPDPYRRGPEAHAHAAATIDVAVQQIAKGLDG